MVLPASPVSVHAANRSDPGFVVTSPQPPGVTGGGGCPTPPVVAPLPFSDSGTTCGATNSINNYNIGSACTNLNFPYPGEDEAYAITVGTGHNFTVSATLTGSTGDLALFLIGTCGTGSTCLFTSQDAIGPGVGPENLNQVGAAPGPITGLASGTYFIYVDSYYAAGSAASCGTYTLNVAGTLPVTLESYGID
jgi:hypothetical protein